MPDQPQPTIKQQRDLKQEMKEQRRQASARQERTKNIITWSIIGLAIAVVVTLIVIGSQKQTATGTLPPVTASDYIQGPTTAPAVLIEYSDFECPVCAEYEPALTQLKAKYGDKLALVYRFFPLRGTHQYADLSAQAAEAAGLQGKFWEMHDLLFSRQNTWANASDVKQTLIGYASELKLDVAKFTTDIDSQAVKDRVNVDYNSATALALQGTPTFYLNGQSVTNPSINSAVNTFSNLIDAKIAGK